MTKKKTTALILTLAMAATAVAGSAALSIETLNARIVQILAPFQDAGTTAYLKFRSLDINQERTLKFEVDGKYRKVGTENFLEVSLSDFSYEYGDGKKPMVKASLYLGTDLTKIIRQEDINDMVPSIESILHNIASDTLHSYGDAATMSVSVKDKKKDENGNYISIDGTIELSLDMDRLRPDQKLSSIAQGFRISVQADVKKGITLSGVLFLNPQSKGFVEDENGMKDVLLRIQQGDTAELESILKTFKSLNRMADEIVNGRK